MKVKGGLGYSDYVMVMFRVLQGEKKKAKSRTTTQQTLTCLGFAWKNHMVYGPGEKRGSRELVGIQAQE